MWLGAQCGLCYPVDIMALPAQRQHARMVAPRATLSGRAPRGNRAARTGGRLPVLRYSFSRQFPPVLPDPARSPKRLAVITARWQWDTPDRGGGWPEGRLQGARGHTTAQT